MTEGEKMHRRTSFVSIMLLALCGSASIMQGDSLNVLPAAPGGNCANITVTSGSATSTCSVAGIAGTSGTSTASGDLATGVFGVSTALQNSLAYGGGGSTEAFVTIDYDFTVTGVTSGIARFAVTTNGVLSTQCSPGICYANAALEYPYGETASVGGVQLPPEVTSSAINGYPANGITNFLISAPIGNSKVELTLYLSVYASCSSGTVLTSGVCTATADFLDPAAITGVQVFNSDGSLVSGATLISESGFNPNAPASVAAPEPGGLLILGLGMLAAGLNRRRVIGN